MSVLRTPTKNRENKAEDQRSPIQSERAGPSPKTDKEPQTSNVRRSIGEWEKETREAESNISPKKMAPAVRTKRTTSPQQIKPKVHRPSVEQVEGTSQIETPKYKDRVTEARACLNRAKQHLGNSRNLKTNIKNEVTESIDRLYQLVKEAESANSIERGEKGKEKDMENPIEEKKRTEVEDRLIEKLEEHSKVLEENRKELEMFRQIIKERESKEERMSYASVTAGGTKTANYVPTHSVAITSMDERDTGDQVIEHIRTAVKAKEMGLRIDRLRKVKDRKVIIGCNTRQELEKIKDQIQKEGKQLKVEEIKNKDPLVRIKDVMSYNTDEDILKAIKSQNQQLLAGLSEEELKMEVKYRRKTRNPLTSNIIMRVSPPVWRLMTTNGVIHVDLQRVKVEDQSPLVQCTRCLGYGHTKRLCTETVDACSHCGGSHLRAECAEWLSGAQPKCKNCTMAKLDRRDHNAFSTECPIKRKWETIARSAVAYC